MSEEKQNNPKFDMRTLTLGGQPVKLTLETAAPIKTGEGKGKYGDFKWFMWIGEVEKADVLEGERGNEKLKKNYSGKVMLFAPNEFVNDQFVKLADGKKGLVVNVSRVVKEAKGKLYNNYVIEKVSAGQDIDNLTTGEEKLISDAKMLKKRGFGMSESLFVESSKDADKYGAIKEDRAKAIYGMV